MATALRLAGGVDTDDVVARRDAFIERVLAEVPGSILTGDRQHRLPGSASFVFPGTSGESILLELERTRRRLLQRFGVRGRQRRAVPRAHRDGDPDAEVAQTAVRFTFGRTTTAADLGTAASRLVDAVSAVSGRGGRPG